MDDLELAKQKLNEPGCTFAAAKDGQVISSETRGIMPVLELFGADDTAAGYEDKSAAKCKDKSAAKCKDKSAAEHENKSAAEREDDPAKCCKTLNGWSVADKVVGKAPAMMYTLLGPDAVYAKVMTKTAAGILERAGIRYSYDVLTDKILRRDGQDICPMEKAVKDLDDPEEAYGVLKETARRMARN